MKRIRKPKEDLEEMLRELKVGDSSIYDEETNYEITKVPNGFVYKNEYVGMVFVPDFPSDETKRLISQAPKPATMAEKKIEKPVKKVVNK